MTSATPPNLYGLAFRFAYQIDYIRAHFGTAGRATAMFPDPPRGTGRTGRLRRRRQVSSHGLITEIPSAIKGAVSRVATMKLCTLAMAAICPSVIDTDLPTALARAIITA